MIYLPVSAIPTTSWPASAAGHEHAWIGVGSLKPSQAARKPAGTSSWSNAIIGVVDVELCMVTECLVRNAWISPVEGGGAALEDLDVDAEAVVEEDAVAWSASVFRFLCFFSFLNEEDSGSTGVSSSAACFRFFLSFLEDGTSSEVCGLDEPRRNLILCIPGVCGRSPSGTTASSGTCLRFFFFSFFSSAGNESPCSSNFRFLCFFSDLRDVSASERTELRIYGTV